MHPIPPGGCHNVPPPIDRPTRASGGDAERQPDLLTYLTMRVRFWIVASWLPREEAA